MILMNKPGVAGNIPFIKNKYFKNSDQKSGIPSKIPEGT